MREMHISYRRLQFIIADVVIHHSPLPQKGKKGRIQLDQKKENSSVLWTGPCYLIHAHFITSADDKAPWMTTKKRRYVK